MAIEPELTLNYGWCIGEEGFAIVEASMRALSPRVILEFGSGRSTIRLCRSFPEARIITFEHDLTYCRHTRQLKQDFGIPDERIQIVEAPLRWQWHGLCRYLSYQRTPLNGECIDALLVDGPPGNTHRGREACLYFAYDALRIGGSVFLDDYRRYQERRILDNWLAVYPTSFEVTRLSTGHGLVILKKVRHEAPRLLTPRRWVDNWQVNVHVTRMMMRARFLPSAHPNG